MGTPNSIRRRGPLCLFGVVALVDDALSTFGDAIGQPRRSRLRSRSSTRSPCRATDTVPRRRPICSCRPRRMRSRSRRSRQSRRIRPLASGSGGDGEASNRGRVLSGWLGLIHQAVGVALTLEDVADSTYQLIHRTASVCDTRAEWRAVVYQGFGLGASEHAEYVAQARRLSALLGHPSTLRFFVLDCPMRETAAYADLRARWAAGERKLSAAVRDGLLCGNLFEHGPCAVTRA